MFFKAAIMFEGILKSEISKRATFDPFFLKTHNILQVFDLWRKT